MMINIDELKSLLLNIKNDKDLFKAQLKEVIKKLTEFSEDFDIYYEIKNDIINNYDIRNKNFYMLHNLNEMTIQYYIDGFKNLKIFGDRFVKENNRKCFIIVGGEKKV